MPYPTLNRLRQNIVVGIGELAVSNASGAVLVTHLLGSCLGVAVYDPKARVAGLLHVMLPDSELDPDKAAAQPGMFVNTGIPVLLRAASRMNADKQRMRIYVAGGAQIHSDNDFLNVGQRNLDSLGALLKQQGLAIAAQWVGGAQSRSMYVHVNSGEIELHATDPVKEQPPCRK